jgi:hypothetical protein
MNLADTAGQIANAGTSIFDLITGQSPTAPSAVVANSTSPAASLASNGASAQGVSTANQFNWKWVLIPVVLILVFFFGQKILKHIL